MSNPILQMLGGKQTNNILGLLNGISNPEAYCQQMIMSNPKFAQFYNENKNKSVDEICRNYGIDPAAVKQFMR